MDGIDGIQTDVDIPPLPPTPIKENRVAPKIHRNSDRERKVKNLPQHVPYLTSPKQLPKTTSLQNNESKSDFDIGQSHNNHQPHPHPHPHSHRNSHYRNPYNPGTGISSYNSRDPKYATLESPIPKQMEAKYVKPRRKSYDYTNHHKIGNGNGVSGGRNLLSPDSSNGSPSKYHARFKFTPNYNKHRDRYKDNKIRSKSKNIVATERNGKYQQKMATKHRGHSHNAPVQHHEISDRDGSDSAPEWNVYNKSAPHSKHPITHIPNNNHHAVNTMAKSKSTQNHNHNQHHHRSVVIDRNGIDHNLENLPSATSNLTINKKPLDVEHIHKKLLDHNQNNIAKLNSTLPKPSGAPRDRANSRKQNHNQVATPPPPIPDSIHKFNPDPASISCVVYSYILL